mmetsp:Transcript_23530/g.30600  ORF Transcript_23530/g.30600 Transcript_23530/m.30600 type:complete len:83 (+) Transcript_23530:317-565(+)
MLPDATPEPLVDERCSFINEKFSPQKQVLMAITAQVAIHTSPPRQVGQIRAMPPPLPAACRTPKLKIKVPETIDETDTVMHR